jgi:hypothetical protein
MKRLGAVIIFDATITKAKAAAMLRAMEVAGVLSPETWIDGRTPVHEFDPEVEGGPVWYIP